jgi:hypothetical protein
MKWHNTTFRGIFFLYTSSNTCSNIFYIKKMHDSIVQRKKKKKNIKKKLKKKKKQKKN